MILALIPARKNSKSVSNKNMKFLAGKPLIHYAITQAKKSKKIDKIVVSSDDKKILEFSKKEHVEIINRPKHLGLDSTSTEKVVIHAINTLEKKGECVDTVIILQPTSPLRNHKDIDGAIRKFQKNKCELLASVKISDVSPYWMYNMKKNVLTSIIKKGDEISRRQNLPKSYLLNGAIFVFKRDTVMEKRKIFGGKTIGYVMPEKRSIDIDSLKDFELAEILMKNGND
jgi:CMP-N,N'-diacetyllegionaminic acid synthase